MTDPPLTNEQNHFRNCESTFMTTALKESPTERRTPKLSKQAKPVCVLAPNRTAYDFAKRTIDLAGSSLALLLLSPIFLVAAALVKLSSPGPVFFPQRRVGRGGREFTCLKFRTMVCDAEDLKQDLADESHHADPRTFKMKRDPRVTRFGVWLRRSSADELPQLLNVLRGEMSLVGPRPPVPSEVALYSERDMKRLAVKPGLTCIWQVSGRADIPFDQQVSMDIDYIQKRSLFFDAKLIAKTLPALLSGKGAY